MKDSGRPTFSAELLGTLLASGKIEELQSGAGLFAFAFSLAGRHVLPLDEALNTLYAHGLPEHTPRAELAERILTGVRSDRAFGYQEAKVNLEFVNIHIPTSIISWWCPFTIGMPLRTEGMGKIPATLAASISEEITVGVARDMDYSLTQGIFCFYFVDEVNAAFDSKYKQLGASAIRK